MPLKNIGQIDHANAVTMVVRRWEKYIAWRDEEDWKGLIKKKFMRRYLGWKSRHVNNLFPARAK